MTDPPAVVLEQARRLDTIRAVLDWSGSRRPPAEFVACVEQDEFTFDVVVRADPATYLVFDTT